MKTVLLWIRDSLASIFTDPLHLLAAVVVVTLVLDTVHDNQVNLSLAKLTCKDVITRYYDVPKMELDEMCVTILEEIFDEQRRYSIR